MTPTPIIAVFAGGISSERDVSLGSGRSSAVALARSFPTQLFELNSDALPAGLDPSRHVVFSTLHGTFGEDGSMQRLLDAAGIVYAGCDAASSALTMDKTLTKRAAAKRGVRIGAGVSFEAASAPSAESLVAELGAEVVLKPNDQGSSVGLTINRSREELAGALARLTPGSWLAERRLVGRELSVGVLRGAAMGVAHQAEVGDLPLPFRRRGGQVFRDLRRHQQIVADAGERRELFAPRRSAPRRHHGGGVPGQDPRGVPDGADAAEAGGQAGIGVVHAQAGSFSRRRSQTAKTPSSDNARPYQVTA